METVGRVRLEWDESDFVERIVRDLSHAESISTVEWIQQSPNSPFQDIIRIETTLGTVFRLALSWVEEEEVEEDFDEAFRQYHLARSFEVLGCSCAVQEHRLKELEAQFDFEVSRFRSSLALSPLGEAIASLKQTISEIDLKEHPKLDRMARDAYPYLEEWIDQQEKSEIEGIGYRELSFRYAREWMAGWRPRPTGLNTNSRTLHKGCLKPS